MLRLSSSGNPVTLGEHPGSILHGVKNQTWVLTRVGSSLRSYQVRHDSGLKLLWTAANIFGGVHPDRDGDRDRVVYPFYVGDLLNTGNDDIVIWRGADGVKAVMLKSNLGSMETVIGTPFKAVFRTERRFKDDYGWGQENRTFLWDFFFGNQSFGLFTRDEDGGPRFYILSKSGLKNRLTSYFKEITEVNAALSPEWSNEKTAILLENLERASGPRQDFLLWGSHGLSVYKFQGKELALQLEAPGIIKRGKGDKLFVGDLHESSGTFRDILVSSEEGLRVFRYDSASRGYLLASSYSESGSLYWKFLYGRSTILADVNGDGKQEVVFNGPQGITAMAFIAPANSPAEGIALIPTWKPVLVTGVFGRPLAILANSLFFRDDEGGSLQMERFEERRDECPKIAGFSPIDQPVEGDIPKPGTSALLPTSAPLNIMEHRGGFLSKPILRWLDRWGLSQVLKDTVHVPTAQARLSIPLAEFSFSSDLEFNIGLDYRSEENLNRADDEEGSILGNGGWSLAAQNHFIMAQFGNGDETPTFYFVSGADYKQIEEVDGASHNYQVNILGKLWELTYDPSKEEWTAKSETEARTYGTNGATRRGLYWPRWTGSTGSDFSKLEERVEMWYMTERQDLLSPKSILKFQYRVESDALPSPHHSLSYTTAVHLQSVKYRNRVEIAFDLGVKPSQEYKKYNPVQVKHNRNTISFPVRQQNKFFLQGITILTSKYKQALALSYATDSKGRFLSKISQKMATGSDDEDLFNFQYDNSGQLVNVVGNHFSVDFKYGTAVIPTPSYITIAEASRSKIVPVSTSNPVNVKVSRAAGFTAVAYKASHADYSIRLKIFDETLEVELTASQNYLRSTPTNERIKDFELVTMDNCVLILENYSTGDRRQVHAFCQPSLEDPTQWSHQWSSGILSKDVILTWSKGAFAFGEKGGSHVTFWYSIPSSHPKFKEGAFKVDHVPVSGVTKNLALLSNTRFIIFNGSDVTLHSMSESSGNWDEKNIFARVSSDENRWLGSIKMTQSDRDVILRHMAGLQLQLVKNAVLFLRHVFDGDLVASTAHLAIVGRTSLRTQTLPVGSSRMSELSKTIPVDFGDVTLKYRKKNGVHTPYCADISGINFVMQARRDLGRGYNSRRSEYKKNTLKSLTDQFEELDSPPVLVNFRWLQLTQEGNVIQTSESEKPKTFARMEGDAWVTDGGDLRQDQGTLELLLGKDIKLEVGRGGNTNMTRYTLRRRDTSAKLWSFQLNSGNGDKMAFAFPNYAAYQTGSGGVKDATHVVPITKNPLMDSSGGEARRQLLRGEKLLGSSDATWLTTLGNNGNLIFRRSAEFLPKREKTIRVLAESTLGSGGYAMTRRLETSFRWPRRHQMERKVELFYGTGKDAHGWMKQSTLEDVLNFEGNSTSTQTWYDGKTSAAVLSKSQQLTWKSKKNDNVEEEKDTTSSTSAIKDISGKWVIADISPNSVTDEMFGYLGFEPYENPGSTWNFPTGNVVSRSDAFSLTGQSYLKLSKGEKVTGVFTPKDKTATYLISTWVQWTSPVYVEKGASLTTKVIFQPGNFHMFTLRSQVRKEAKDGWTLLELMVDLSSMTRLYSEFFEVKKREFLNDIFAQNVTSPWYPHPSDAQCSLTIVVSNEQGGSADIHVDHIRFHPALSEFPVTVFQSDAILFTPPSEDNEVAAPPPHSLILGNGEILTKMYDPAGTFEIGAIDETGTVEQLTSTGNSRNGLDSPRVGWSTVQFSPEVGFYESFHHISFQTRWELDYPAFFKVSRGQLWHTGNGNLSNILSLKPRNLNLGLATTIRFRYHFDQPSSQITLNWGDILKIFLQNSGPTPRIKIGNSTEFEFVGPATGEIIAFLRDRWCWVWSEGQLLGEFQIGGRGGSQQMWEEFSIEFTGPGRQQLQDLVLLTNPEVTVQYFNVWGKPMQTIKLENASSAQVMETLYDEVGREAIRTKATRLIRGQQGISCLLCFQEGFITNGAPQLSNSVLKTGKIEGLANILNPGDLGYPYWRTVYEATPLEEKLCEGSPGKEFTCGEGLLVTRTPRESNLARLANLFPPEDGFTEKVKIAPNGSIHVRILNKEGKEAAHYVHVPGHDHLLATQEFDQRSGKMTRILPPQYHSEMGTMARLKPWKFGMSEEHFSKEEVELQRKWHTRFTYDDQGNLIKKETPDAETRHYLYDGWGNMRFSYGTVIPTRDNDTNTPTIMAKDISYFLYSEQRQLAESGVVPGEISEKILKKYLNVAGVPRKEIFQKIDHFDLHLDPELRGRLRTILSYNGNVVGNSTSAEHPEGERSFVLESVRFNDANAVIATKVSTSSSPGGAQLTRKIYRGGRLRTLVYPTADPITGVRFHLVHSYDNMGNLIALGTPDNPSRFAKFNWLPGGVLASETMIPNSTCGGGFTRNFRYNSPGHLIQIEDPFITEEMEYTQGGYGQNGFGDGLVMRTTFNASWASMNPNPSWFHVDTSSVEEDLPMMRQLCVWALQRLGFLHKSGTQLVTPIKILTMADFPKLPSRCRGRTGIQLMEMISRKMPPGNGYGHACAYGNHMELVKAKYFDDSQDISKGPLMPNTFSKEVEAISLQQSNDIWEGLKALNIINTELRGNDSQDATGWGRIKDVLGQDDLANLLDEGEDGLGLLAEQILGLVAEKFGGGRITNDELYELILTWKGGRDVPLPQALLHNLKKSAEVAFQVLNSNGYISEGHKSLAKILNPKMLQAMADIDIDISSETMSKIMKVLLSHFENQLGEGPYDLESFKIDANGNHREFVVGQERWEFLYEGGTNRISEIHVRDAQTYGEPGDAKIVHKIEHDQQGNVIKAPHLKVSQIKYHPMSNRPIKFELEDGKTIELEYDAAGERIRKCVKDPTGKIMYDLHYYREEKGKVLMDHRMEYDGRGAAIIRETRTTYVYGTRGYLLGFLRNSKFFTVHTDHSGSTRLVTEGGRVVGAYDYLPYGHIMRVFGDAGRDTSEGHLVYRYSAQEWDEETGLYNFHSRLYDPSIGRFLQMDPQGQYWSPYKFAGNSPISFTDPDGQLAFLIACIIGAIIGAYLGGAAANGSYNPLKWRWDVKTAIGMIGGAIAGGFLPVALKASIATLGVKATIGIGSTFALMGFAATMTSTPNLEPYSPEVIFGTLMGFSTGVGLVGGIGTLHHFAGKMGSFGKYALLTTSYATGAGLAYHGVATFHNGDYRFWKWDKFFEPGSIMALANGFDMGSGWPLNFKQLAKGSYKIYKRMPNLLELGKSGYKLVSRSDKSAFKSFLKAATKLGANEKVRRDAIKLGGIMLATYYHVSAANENFDPSKWDMHKFSTYEGALNGIFFGKDIQNSLKYIRDASKSPKSHTAPNLESTAFKFSLKEVAKTAKSIFKNLGNQISAKNWDTVKLVERILSGNPGALAALKTVLRDQRGSSSGTARGDGAEAGDGSSSSNVPRLILDVERVARTIEAEGSRLLGDADVDSQVAHGRLAEDADTIRLIDEDDDDTSGIRRTLEEEGVLKCGGGSRRKRGLRSSPCIEKIEGVDAISEPEKNHIENANMDRISILIRMPVKDNVQPTAEYRSKRTKVDGADVGFTQGKINSNHVHTISVEGHATRTKALSEELAQFLQEIPSKTLGSGSFLLQAVKGMLDGAALGKSGLENGIFIAKELDQVTIDGTPVEILHAFVKNGDKLSLKSFLSVEEKAIVNEITEKNTSTGIPIPDLDITVKSHMNNLKLPEAFAGKTVDSTVYIMYKERSPQTSEGGGGVTTHLLVMTPEVNNPPRGGDHPSRKIVFEAPNKNLVEGLEALVVDTNLVKTRADAMLLLEKDLEPSDINNLSHSVLMDLATKKVAMENFMNNMVKAFENGKLATSAPTIEADFQGYVYGVLRLAIARKLELDLRTEMIAGKGYLDIGGVSHVSAKGALNWASSVPFVMELKHTTKSEGSVDNAMEQIRTNKYAHNLFFRHSSEFAILVAANPLASGVKVLVQVTRIPKLVFVADLILQGGYKVEDIAKALDYSYDTTSNMAQKTGSREYASSRLLGGLSRESQGSANMKLYLASTTRRERAPAKTRVLAVWEGSNRMLDLNFVERRKTTKVDPNPIPSNHLHPGGNMAGFQVSKMGIVIDPYSDQAKPIISMEDVDTGKVNWEAPKALIDLEQINSGELLLWRKDAWGKVFGNFGKLRGIFTSESHVQGYLHGLFEQAPVQIGGGVQLVRSVWMEANPNHAGRVDLLVRTYEIDAQGFVKPDSQTLTAIEIKLLTDKNTSKNTNIEIPLRNAQQQNSKYGEFAIVTDAKTVTQLTVVFDGREVVPGEIGVFGWREADIGHLYQSNSAEIQPVNTDINNNDWDPGEGSSNSFDLTPAGARRRRDVEQLGNSIGNVTVSPACPSQNSQQSATSGSTSIHSSWLGSSLKHFGEILRSSLDYMTNLFSSTGAFREGTIANRSDQEKSESAGTNGISPLYCQNGAWNGDGYSMDAITCLNTGDGSSTMVFSKLGSDLEGGLVKTGYQRVLLGDNYSKDACRPLEFNGRPSVTCPGEKSDFVHTPGPNYFNKTFDNVDGHIMLGAVVLNKIWSAFLGGGADPDDKFVDENQDEMEETKLTPEAAHKLKDRLAQMEQFLEEVDAKMGWVANTLEDLHDDLESRTSLASDDMESFEERIGALWEDILEELQLMSGEDDGIPKAEPHQVDYNDKHRVDKEFMLAQQQILPNLQKIGGSIYRYAHQTPGGNIQRK